ncbi:aminotransferase class V-fold PLP-dependent enzyme [Clostridiaceae bacterium NSJ-31]|uniref:cysteine desulfurase n=1 Tax=Ligaoa zhengdingensis TaxID=2763658 RepID=A0A926DVB5_9FIRM|nr:aminotransferase class V-fold PLP-dependent enzyme [Ligaoa zhengdingensis]MBC8545371.1 aminotransferase class V-fold PLP-dependent enzyme [Ligaoa zhengdingensis]
MGTTNKIYLDHASTSYPKAPGVAPRMCEYLEQVGCNVSRGEYETAYDAAEVVFNARERLARLFNFPEPHNVIFTSNVTTALNLVIKGGFHAGDHLLVSAMEHNAVMRPLTQMLEAGVTFDRIPCDESGELQLECIESLIHPNTRAVVMLHASNVSGTLYPVEQVGRICHKHSLRFVVDSAQTAGVFPIDMEGMYIDALCFTGHKGLLGPQGIGGLLIREEFAREITPLISGGTGSFSHLETVPELLPDRFEAGTLNLPGIYGLNAALEYLERIGIDSIRTREQELAARFTAGMERLPGVRVVGSHDAHQKAGIVSLDFGGRDNAELSFLLDSEYGIMTRCGLHCAPNAHKTLGTYPQGTVRFSVGYSNTEAEIDFAVEALHKLLKD